MDTEFVIMGLPASGKTTFLAALWHIIESDEIECRLKLDRYEGDYGYLNRISEAWRNFEKVPRTSQVGDTDVTIHVVDEITGLKGAAFFPDLAGETFDKQFEARLCRPEFIDAFNANDGILLFISADVKGNGFSIAELNSFLPIGEAQEPVEEARPAREWEPKLVPAQVRIVQLLSDVLRSPFEPRRRRLAVMISAWDLVSDMGVSPEEWLASHMPLVSQFIRANALHFTPQIYGISAQGVDLDDQKAVDQATDLLPSRRVLIVGDDGAGNDLTSPLVWLMAAE